MTDWPKRVLAIRATRRESQRVFAAMLGVTEKSVGRWEKGETVPLARIQFALEALERDLGLAVR